MVTSGGLARIQIIASMYLKSFAEAGNPKLSQDLDKKMAASIAKLADNIPKVNSCFPDEIVKYYSPGYSTVLLSKIDEFAASTQKSSPGLDAATKINGTKPSIKNSLKTVAEQEVNEENATEV
jgi:hypothetical protein